METRRQYRQGDVLLVEFEIPKTAIPQSQKNKLILAYGEATGHSHAIYADAKKIVSWNANAERFVQVIETVILQHEEHAEIITPPGNYLVAIQHNYTLAELRKVTD